MPNRTKEKKKTHTHTTLYNISRGGGQVTLLPMPAGAHKYGRAEKVPGSGRSHTALITLLRLKSCWVSGGSVYMRFRSCWRRKLRAYHVKMMWL